MKSKHPKLTDAVVSSVNAYMMAQAMAETMRERVDEVHRDILKECPIYADKEHADGKPIYDSGKLYLTTDDVACQDFYAEADVRLKEAKIKPAAMDKEKCPALVAENLQTDVETLLLRAVFTMLDGEPKAFICLTREKRKMIIEMTISQVVSQPGFKNPLTQELIS